MRKSINGTKAGLWVALPVLLSSAIACSQGPTSSPIAPSAAGGSTSVLFPSPGGTQPGVPEQELFEVCKIYEAGSGPTVTFNITIDAGNNGSIDHNVNITLDHGECEDVWLGGGTIIDNITVTETVPAGYSSSYVVGTWFKATQTSTPVITTGSSVAGNSTSGLISGNRGVTVTFTNTLNPPPPPPPGGEGCTPGYWKQPHHFDSWSGYAPTDLFSSVFEDAFPGMTLVKVLGQGGGGLKALGRHTVAALLNASSSGVSYPMTTTEIINAFNAVHPGGDYETLKNQFEAWNEAGCPLN